MTSNQPLKTETHIFNSCSLNQVISRIFMELQHANLWNKENKCLCLQSQSVVNAERGKTEIKTLIQGLIEDRTKPGARERITEHWERIRIEEDKERVIKWDVREKKHCDWWWELPLHTHHYIHMQHLSLQMLHSPTQHLPFPTLIWQKWVKISWRYIFLTGHKTAFCI